MPPLTEEQLQELLSQRFDSPEGIARLNPLAFQFEDAFTPYSSAQMNALKTMRLPGGVVEPGGADPAFFSDFIKGYDFDPYKGTKEDFNYLYGTRPAFLYDPSGTAEVLEPLKNLGIDTSYGVANEPDQEQVESLTEPTGIEKLFKFLGSIPTPFNILKGGLESLKGFNQRLRNTDFGQSKTLQEYFQRREARKDNERLQTVGKQLQEAAERGGGYQETNQKQNVSRTTSRRTDKGVGQGGVYGL